MDIAKDFKQTIEVLKELNQYLFTAETKSKFETLLQSVETLQSDWKNKKVTDDEAHNGLVKLQSGLINIFTSASPDAAKIIAPEETAASEIIERIYHQLLPKEETPSFWQDLFPHIGNLTGIINHDSINIQSTPSRGIFSILKNLNPFKKKNSFNDFEKMIDKGSSGGEAVGKSTSKAKPPEFTKPPPPPAPAEKGPQAPPVERHTTKAKPPMPQTVGAEPPLPSAEGKILYDIPDAMIVNQSKKCIVRIGENEAIVRDDDSFSSGVQVENVKLSNKMQVELIDISDPPKFRIKTFSAAKQFLEEGGYTEWIFTVTPLESGTFPIYLKVSIIKIINGEEVPREIVFEKSINITAAVAEDQGLVMSTSLNPAQPKQETPALKDLAKETKVVELPTPKIFISYAHNDKIYFDIFLSNFQSQSGWNIWTDRNIEIGSDWFSSIQQSMQQSDCAVLLISSDFISSAFIKEHEFKKFSELKESKPGFIFLPILLRDCDFTRWQDLSKIQMFSALGGDYNVHFKETKLIPFADLCSFFDNGLLKPNPNIDTYFKNLVMQANKQWIEINKPAA